MKKTIYICLLLLSGCAISTRTHLNSIQKDFAAGKFTEITNDKNISDENNLDLLIEYQNEKKIVLYGGCNFTYGIYSPMIEEAFDDYKVINCGLNGEFNSLFQMEIIEKYLNQDDIFIHCPEQMNGYQFMKILLVDILRKLD